MVFAGQASAWDAHGHRTITSLAIDMSATSTPDWVRAGGAAARVADEAVVPDRWRGVRSASLSNASNPDHYIDLEELAQLGLELKSAGPLRYEFVRAVALARVNHPVTPPVSAGADPAKVADWPGFLPWAICENHARVINGFKTVRMLEKLRDDARASGRPDEASLRDMQLVMAKEDVLHYMGLLSHFVGDAAQPLHTTIHHHGWIGDNPKGYTTERGIHAYIDGTIVSLHNLDFASLHDGMANVPKTALADPINSWPEVVAYIERSFAQVDRLYELKKSGELEAEPGKTFIADRMRDAAGFLGSLYAAAWAASEPTEDDIKSFLKYDKVDEGQFGGGVSGVGGRESNDRGAKVEN